MKEWLKAESIEDVQNFYEVKYIKDGLDAFRCNNWDFFYSAYHLFFPNEVRPTDSILDCGCGGGHFLKDIIKRYPLRHPYLCGIELTECGATTALENTRGGATICQGSYLSKDSFLPNSFDIVTCWGTIEHAPNLEEAFERLVDYAKPGGIIMITVPLEFEGCLSHIENEPNPKNNERFATREEWLSIFSPFLKPFLVEQVEGDLLMVFRKWVQA